MSPENNFIRIDIANSAFTPILKPISVEKALVQVPPPRQEESIMLHSEKRESSDVEKPQQETEQRKGKKKLVEWTREEDTVLFDRYIHNGPKWVEIAQIFPSKNDNDVKNRFYCCLRKVLKRINYLQKSYKLKPKKLLGLDSLLTVLEIGKLHQSTPDKRFMQVNKNIDSIIEARNSIIEEAVKPEIQLNYDQLVPLVERLLDLKHCLKFINVKRVKKCAGKDSSHCCTGEPIEHNESNSEMEEDDLESQNQKKKTQNRMSDDHVCG